MKLSEIFAHNALDKLESFSKRQYAQNMAFLSQLNPKLFKALQEPPKQYNLYLDKQHLNIIDVINKSFIYPVENDKHTMIERNLALAENPLKNPAYTLHTNNLYLQKMDSTKLPFTAGICNEMIEIMQNEYNGPKSFKLPTYFLPSMTIFGLLGGAFLQILLEKGYTFHALLLFEEEIDIFRICLYFIDFPLLFTRVSERACYIFVKDLIHKAFVQHYFTQKKITNNFLRLSLRLYDSPKMIRAEEVVSESYRINARGWGSFEDEMIGIKHTFTNIGKKANLAHSIFTPPLASRVNVPICVVGNGASLDDLLPFIKDNADKMIILSCGTALKPLKNVGINPDFHIEIERIDYLREVLESAPLGETTLLCGNMVQPSALSLAKEGYIFLRGGSASAYMGAGKCIVEFGAPYVGNAGFALACLLGDEILICGLDCGYIQGRSKHSKDSYYGDEALKIPKNAYKVPSNAESEVYADALFSLSSMMISKAITMYKPNLVLNLGKGALIQGAKSVKTDDFILRKIDKTEAIKTIKSYMKSSRKEVFQHWQKDEYIKDIEHYKNTFISALSVKIQDKGELFRHIDKLHTLSINTSAKMPFVGLLFEGSIGHILHVMMICALHIPKIDISMFYARCVDSIALGLNKMCLSYKLSLHINHH